MNLLPTMDNVLYNVQRQGKISFWVSDDWVVGGGYLNAT